MAAEKKPKKDQQKYTLEEYKAIKNKDAIRQENKLPLAVKLFIAFPLAILCLILCFGIFCIPHLSTLSDDESQDSKAQ